MTECNPNGTEKPDCVQTLYSTIFFDFGEIMEKVRIGVGIKYSSIMLKFFSEIIEGSFDAFRKANFGIPTK